MKKTCRAEAFQAPARNSEPLRAAVHPVAAAVALAIFGLQGYSIRVAHAEPTGGQVTAGAATIQQTGAQTLINQSTNRAAIDWNGFSIGAGESVIFRQPSAASVALNRVVGPDPSRIFGTLQANGQVFLINPSGVLFGRGASVDVAGLVASTLSISNNDFMAGRYVFSGGAGAGRVVNEANIQVKDGGYVAFLGNQVSNTGTLVSSNGSVALGAGDSMTLDFNGDGLLSLKVNAAAAGAKIDHSGAIQADGGMVVMSAAAKNALLDTVLNVEGIVQARGATMRNGAIYLEGGSSGVTRVAGTLDASNTQGKGGEIRVLGENVGLFDRAKLDASGNTGGGAVLIGGDYQGRNPDVPNARRTIVGRDVTIAADAGSQGDGGKVVVWSDDTTKYYGNISARGGAQGGDGGFAEVSGKGTLEFRGNADLRAARGRAGTLLLDPIDLAVIHGDPVDNQNVAETAGSPYNFESSASPSTVTDGAINAQLSGANVVVQTGAGTGGNGDITFGGAQPIVFSAAVTANNLTFQAHRHIIVDQATSYTNGTGLLTLMSGTSGTDGSISVNAPISSQGSILLAATGSPISDITVSQNLQRLGESQTMTLRANRHIVFDSGADVFAGGAVVLNADRDGTGGGAIQIGAGSTINSGGGAITLGGGADPLTTAAIGTADRPRGVTLGELGPGNGATLLAFGGNITITGAGYAGADAVPVNEHYGVNINGGTVQTTGAGTISITGEGRGTGSLNVGAIFGNNALISTANGAVTVRGTSTASGTGFGNAGVVSNARIEATGSGSIAIEGIGAGASGADFGVFFNSAAAPSTQGIVTAATGNIAITGTGTGDALGILNDGTIGGGVGDVLLHSKAGGIEVGSVYAGADLTGTPIAPGTGTRNVTLRAEGGGAVTQSTGNLIADGLRLLSDAASTYTLTSAANSVVRLAGDVNGSVAFTNSQGFDVAPVTTAPSAGAAATTTTGLTVTGDASLTALNAGSILIPKNNAVTSSNGGAITLIADDLNLDTSGGNRISTSGAVTLTANDPTRTIDIGFAVGGELSITSEALQTIAANSLTVGRDSHAGVININADTTLPAQLPNLTLVNNTAGIAIGADLTVPGTLTLTANGGGAVTGAITRTAGTLSGTSIALNAATGIGDQVTSAIFVAPDIPVAATNTTSGMVHLAAGTGTLVVGSGNVANAGGDVLLRGDEMTLTGTVTGANVALESFGLGVPITLGTDTAGLNFSNADLSRVTTPGVLAIGNAAVGGAITIDAPISAPATWSTLSLRTGDAIVDANADPSASIAATSLALRAANGIGTSATPLRTQVSNLSYNNSTAGGVFVDNAGSLTIASVDGIGGPSVLSAGETVVRANATSAAPVTLTVGADGITSSGGNISLLSADHVALNGGVDASAGGVTIEANSSRTADAANPALGAITQSTGTVTGSAVTLGAATGIGSGGTINTSASTINAVNTTSGDVDISNAGGMLLTGSNAGGGSFTARASFGTLTVDSGNVNANTGSVALLADDMAFTGTITGNGGVTLAPFNAGTAISLGTNAGPSLTLTGTMLGQVTTTGVLTIGANDSGAITLAAPISGSASTWNTLSLHTGDSITTANATGNPDITATSLALRAVNGIGASGTPIQTAVSNVAFVNTGGGGVSVDNLGALTVAGVDGITTSNGGSGGLTLSTHSPLTIAADIIQTSDITLTAGDSPGPGDDLTVNANVTIRSTGPGAGEGNVTLSAGDNIVLGTGSKIESRALPADPLTAGKTITLTAGTGGEQGSITGAGVIASESVVLDARSGVGTGTGARIPIDAAFLAARSRDSGGVFVDSTAANPLTLQTIGVVANGTNGGAYDITAAGPVTVASPITTLGGNVALTASTIDLNDTIDTRPAALTSQNGGAVNLTASGAITTTATIDTRGATGADGAPGTGEAGGTPATNGLPGAAGGSGGAVTIASTANGAVTLGGSILTGGGAGGVGGAPGASIALDPAFPGADGASGAGGAVTVSAGSGAISLSSVDTSGGSGPGAGGAGGAITATSTSSITLTNTLTTTGGTATGLQTNNGGDGGAITFQGPVVLGANVSINTVGGGPAGGDGSLPGTGGTVRFASTLDATNAFVETLDITANTGNVVFQGAVGGLQPLGSLTINSAFHVAGSDDGATAAGPIRAGAFTQTLGFGNTNLSGIDTSGAADATGGNVSISTFGNLTVTGAIDTSGGTPSVGNGLNGGSVSLAASAMSLGPITTNGSAAVFGTGGSAGSITTSDPGSGALTVTLNGNVTARGGNAGGADQTGGNGATIAFGHGVLLATNVTVDALGGSPTGTGSAGTDGDVTFSGTVDSLMPGSERSLSVNTGGITTFGSFVGGGTALASLTTDAGGSTQVNGGVTTTGTQTYNDALVLGADTTLASTAGGDITFNSTIESTNLGPPQFGLTVNTTGTTTFAGNVGPLGTLAPSFLTIGAGGTTVFTDSPGGFRVVFTDGPQTYGSPVVLNVDTNFISCGCQPGDITFSKSVNANAGAIDRAMGVSANGSVIFSDNVGDTAPLAALLATTNGVPGAAIRFNGAAPQTIDVTAPGPISPFAIPGIQLLDPVALQQNVSIKGGADGLFFYGTIDGGFSLSTSSGLTTFSGAIGGATPLASLTAGGGDINLNGGTVRTTGAQTYNDRLFLGANTTLTSTAGGAITFANVVEGDGLASRALTVDTSGTTTFGDLVGAGNRLDSLTVNGGGPIAINDPVSSGSTIGTVNAQTYNGPVTLSGASVFLVSDGSGAITLASTVDSTASAPASALTVTTGGQVTFGGAVGSTRALDALTTNGGGPIAINGGTVTTVNAQTYDAPVTIGGASGSPATFSGDDLTFQSTLTAGNHPLTLTGNEIDLNGAVSGTAALVLQPKSDIGVEVGGAASTAALNLTDTELANLADGFASITIGSASSTSTTFVNAVTFTDPVVLRGGLVAVGSPVTGNDNASVTITPTPGTGVIGLGANISTQNNAITLNGPFSLTADATLDTTLPCPGCVFDKNILLASSFGSSVTPRALTLVTGGSATFGGDVGFGTPLSGLDVTAANTIFSKPGVLQFVNVFGTGAGLNLRGPVTLEQSVLANTGSNAATFGSTVDADTGARALTVLAPGGTARFDGNMGGAQPLAGLSVTANSILLNAGTVDITAGSAVNTVNFGGPVTLGASPTITTAGKAVGFFGTIDADNAAASDRVLTVNAGAGAVTFGGNVGAGANGALAGLDVTGGTINLNAATFNVNDANAPARTVTFNGPAVLGANVTINTDRTVGTDSSVTFGSIDADNSAANDRTLTVTAGGGTATFNGAIGTAASGALADLDVTAGAIAINTSTINVNDANAPAQTATFTGPVTLGSALTVTSDRAGTADSSILFSSTIDGGRALTLNAGSGQVDVQGAVTVASLDATGGTRVNLAGVTSTGAVNVTGDDMTLGTIAAAGQTVTLRNFTAGRAISLGAEPAGSLGLSAAEIAGISAGALRIGRNDGTASGAFTIASDVTPSVSTLHLLTGAGITGTAGGIVLPAGALAIEAAGPVSITDPQNDIGTLAANSGASNLTLTNAGSLAIGVVDGVTGVTGADLTLTSAGQITGAAPITGVNVVLDSATGVGTGTGARVNTSAATLAARSRVSGGVFVNETNAVTLNTIGSVANSAAGAAGYDLVASGAITVEGPVSTAGVITSGVPGASATSGGITLLATAGSITGAGTLTTGAATANGSLGASGTQATSGSIVLTAASGSISTGTLTTGAASMLAANGNDSATSGSITLNAQAIGTSAAARQSVATGSAGGGDTNTQGELAATTTGPSAAGAMFLGSAAGFRAGALAAQGGGASIDMATTGGAAITLDADVTANGGSVSIDAPVILARDVVIATGTGNVTLAQTVNGTQALLVNSTGTTTFGGAVGGTTALTSLATDAGGTTAINGGAITTAGNQTYNDTVTLGANTILTGAAGTFTGGVTGNGNDLTLNFAGLTSISGGAIAGVRNLAAGNGGTTSLSGSIATTGTQTYTDNVTLAGDTILTGTTPIFGGTVAGGGNDLALNFSGATNITGAFTGIRDLATGNGGTTNLSGAITTSGVQTYNDNVVLTGNAVLTGTAPTFGGTVAGAGNDLTLDFSGTTNITGAFTGIRDLATGNGGTTNLSGAIATTGAQTYLDNVVLAANTTLTGTTPTFGGTVVGGGNDLTLNFSGATNLNGAFTGIRNLATGNGGTTNLSGTITTSGTQTYGDAVTLTGGAVVDAGANAITFADAVDGAGNLTVNTSGLTTFAGAVGGVTPLASLTTNAGGATAINGGSVRTAGDQAYNDAVTLGANTTLTGTAGSLTGGVTGNGNDLTLNLTGLTSISGGAISGVRNLASGNGGTTSLSGSITTSGTQTYADNVTLAGDAFLTGTTPTFGGTVTGGGNDLTLNFSGTTDITGAFTGIRNLSSGDGGTTNLSGAITTTGAQTYGDNVVLAGNTTLTGTTPTFGGTVTGGGNDLTLNFTGVTNITSAFTGVRDLASGNGGTTSLSGSITTTGTQTYTDSVTLAGDTTLTGTTPTFGGTVTGGGNDLTLNFSGTTSVTAAFTGIRNLATGNGGTTNLSGAITTTGTQTYGDDVVLTGNTVLTGTTPTFGGTVTGGGNDLALNFSGTTNITTAFTGIRNLASGEGGTTNLSGAVATTGSQSYGDAVTLGADTTLTGTAATFTGGVTGGGNDLTLNLTGLTTIGGGAITGVRNLASGNGGTTNLSGSITTTGAQTYGDDVVLAGNTVLTGTTPTFGGTVAGGGNDLTLNFSGPTNINGAFTNVRDLATGNGGTTNLSGAITTSGVQTYGDNVVLTGNTVLTGATPTFGGTLTGGGNDLTLNFSGTTNITGAFTGIRNLASGNGGTTNVSGAITTTGAQAYGDNVVLGDNTLLSGTTPTFGGTVAGGGNDLTLNFSGPTSIDGRLTGVRNLATGNGGTTNLSGTITTAGTQTYGDDVVLTGNTALAGTTPTFGGTVTGGGNDLALNFSGTTNVTGAFTGIRNLTTGNGGTTNLSGAITTTGTQIYGDAAVLAANTTLNASALTFSTVDGAFTLSANSAGATTFGGAVGSVTPLAALTTNAGGTTAITGGAVTTTGAQTYGDDVTLGANTVLNAGAGSITFAAKLDAPATPRALTVNSTGTVTFGGLVGSTAPLASITANAGGTTRVETAGVTTTSSQSYGDAVIVGANATLTSNTGNITFGATLDADATANDRTLAVNAPTGTVTFSGNVGASQMLADLDVIAGPDTIVFNAPASQTVNVTGAGGNTVTFTGNVRLDQNLALNTGSLTFFGAVDADAAANGRTLTVNAGAGDVNFSAVGNAQPLGLLNLDAGTIAFNARAVGETIVVSANAIFTPNAASLIQALLPFSGYDGPAALTLTGPASGGLYGSEAAALSVNVPGLLVVTPNESRSLPIVWLRGDPAVKPFYEFYNAADRRLVFYNGPPPVSTDFTQATQPARDAVRDEQRRFANELTESTATSDTARFLSAEVENAVRAPEVCTTTSVDEKGALACAEPKAE